MTVAALPSVVSYVEDGATVAIPVPYRFQSSGLIVERILDGVALPLAAGVDYTVAGGDTDQGGTLTRTIATDGATLRIRRATPLAQDMSYTTGDRFPATSHEAALDQQTMGLQDLSRDAGEGFTRALQVPVGEVAPDLPPAASRRGTVLTFNPSTGEQELKPIGSFPAGPPGGSNNTYTSYSALQASDPTRKYAYLAGDTDVPARPDGAYVNTSGVLGAWVPQPAAGVAFRQRGAVYLRSVGDKLEDGINIRDFGAHEAKDDNTDYINAALAYAGSLSIERPPFDGYGYVLAGGGTVVLPDGRWDVGQIIIPQNVSLAGAGKHSTALYSGYDGPIVRNAGTPTQTGTYDEAGISIRDLGVIGDLTKPQQVGFAFLRLTSATVENLLAEQCGGNGFTLYQCGVNKFGNIEAINNGGNGLDILAGFNSWSDQTANLLPSNANIFTFIRCLQNRLAGIRLSNGANGNQFYGANAEYNYRAAPAHVGYNVHVATDAYSPNVFYDLWTEGPCQAHVYVACTDASILTKFINWKHFGTGVAGDVDRALIVNGGAVMLDAPYGTANSYRALNGRSVPFRILNKQTSAILIRDARGANVSGVGMVDDGDGNVTGFFNNLRQNNSAVDGFTYGDTHHVGDAGSIAGWTVRGDTDAFPRLVSRAATRDLLFGDGASAADAGLKRVAAGQVGPRPGDFINTGGAWDGSHLIMGGYHIWIGPDGKPRGKAGPPTGPNDGSPFTMGA